MINSGDCFKCPFKHRPQSPMTHFSIVSWSLTRKGCFISFLDSFPPSWMLGPPASLESVVESWRSTPFWDVWNRFFRFSREKKAPTTNSRVRTPEKRTAVAFVLVGTYVHHMSVRYVVWLALRVDLRISLRTCSSPIWLRILTQLRFWLARSLLWHNSFYSCKGRFSKMFIYVTPLFCWWKFGNATHLNLAPLKALIFCRFSSVTTGKS